MSGFKRRLISFSDGRTLQDDLVNILEEIDKDKEDALLLIAKEAKRIDDLSWEYRRERSMGRDYKKPKLQESDLQNPDLRDQLKIYFNKQYSLNKQYELQDLQDSPQTPSLPPARTSLKNPPQLQKIPYKTNDDCPESSNQLYQVKGNQLVRKSRSIMPKLDSMITVSGDSKLALREFGNLAQVNYDQQTYYRAVKGDKVDELFCQILNAQNLEINIQRLGPGKYIFGSK